MIEITSEQIDRVSLILSGVPGGAEKALASIIRRANTTVRSESVKQIAGVYNITATAAAPDAAWVRALSDISVPPASRSLSAP